MDATTTTMMGEGLVGSLPFEALPASAAVDALHLSAGLKTAFRCRLLDSVLFPLVKEWSEGHGLAARVDEDGFICVARTMELAVRVLELDRSREPHERALGLLLGYPSCCCEFVAHVGESNIDMVAAEMREWRFVGEYRLIDPSGYICGTSLICHLPCSRTCLPSLALARSALGYVNHHRLEPGFGRWGHWL
jgi:hypothetical protein